MKQEFLKVKSNIDLEKLLSYAEVGYLREVFEELSKRKWSLDYNFYFYFKRTSEQGLHINDNDVDSNTILFLAGDEGVFLPEEIAKRVKAIFKTYLKVPCYKNIFYLPVGNNPRVKASDVNGIDSRQINVFFSGNLHIGRAKLYAMLSGFSFVPFMFLHRLSRFFGKNFDARYPQSHIQFTKGFAAGLSANQYSDVLHDSKIVLCPPGNPGIETMRHYEAMRAGCIIISEVLPSVFTFKNSPILVVNSWHELDEIVSSLLDNNEKMKQLQRKTLQWWNEVCSPPAVVDYIIKSVESLTIQKA